jgi:diacylglycerol kinase (ATP)
MKDQKKWVFIVNPTAGNGDAVNVAEELKEKLIERNFKADIVFTENKGHATELSEKFASLNYNFIIGVGGDGTFNEIAVPLINYPSVTTGLIPGGTGNDFIQILGYPNRFTQEDWDAFFESNTIKMDVGSCNGVNFLNGMGLGFDAQVAAENYTEPGEVKKGGKNKYIWHILKTLLFFREKKMIVSNNDNKTESDCFINTVSIGRRFAGGFYLTPEAIANDGLLDVCSIKKLNLIQRLKILMMVPKGTHIHDEKVNYFRAEKLMLEFKDEVPFHIDGELYFSKLFDINILPEALNVIYKPAGPHFFK